MPRTINVPIEITDQFAADVMTTALEGGVGYWLQVGKVHRAQNKDGLDQGLDYLSIYQVDEPRDAETEELFDMANFKPGFEVNRPSAITLNHVFKGIEMLFERGVLPGRDDIRASVSKLEQGDIDSDAADVILQLGFFGDTVFG